MLVSRASRSAPARVRVRVRAGDVAPYRAVGIARQAGAQLRTPHDRPGQAVWIVDGATLDAFDDPLARSSAATSTRAALLARVLTLRHVRERRFGSADGGKVVARERFRHRLMMAATRSPTSRSCV
jgi:hypothetical protein